MSEHRELEEAIDEEAILVAQILEDSIEKGRTEDPTEVAPRAGKIPPRLPRVRKPSSDSAVVS